MKRPLVLQMMSIAVMFVLSASNLPSPAATQAPLSPSTSPTSAPTIPPKPNEYITIAQLNLWFHGPGCFGGFEAFDCSGKRNTSLTPALGVTYDSASKDVISQQIEWATAYGVDAFSIEWTTPRGVSGSPEDILDDNFLKAPNLHKMRWCIFYDLVLRIQQTPGLKVDLSNGMDFDNPDVYNTFVADFDHFANKYFGQEQYLKIDERPVLYIWGTWNAKGNYSKAFQEARQRVAGRGYDVYIVGDIIRTDHFYPKLASVFDANTNFVFFTPGTPPNSEDVGEAAVKLDEILSEWEKKISGLKVDGRQEDVILQPGFAPQFDNRLAAQVNHEQSFIYIPAMNKDQVTTMAEVVRKHAHPVGNSGMKLIWLNTWNCWGETTTFEPTAALGPKYPAGNYEFDMLEVTRGVFGPEIFPNLPPSTPKSTEAMPPDNVTEPSFTGTWQGNDPDDNSTISLILRQAGNQVEGTFSDTFSKQHDGALIRPGYLGQGSGNIISSTEAKMSFDLTHSDGASIHLDIRLILSNENTTLTLEVPQSSSIVLNRQQ